MTDRPSFARRVRAAKPRAKKYEIWDDVISGLGLSVRPTGVRTYFLRPLVRRRDHYANTGNADTMSLPEARREARKLVASYFDTTRKDNGPMSERPGVANRAMPVLSMMMRMAELWGYRVHNTNPCTNTRRFKMTPKERFLSPEEIGRLNTVLTRDEFYCPQTIAIIRLLLLSGCRFREVAALEWDWIKGKRIHLPDSKSGPRTVWLSGAASAVIDAVPRYSPECPYVFPGRPADRPTGDISNDWGHIRREAGLPDVRLHDLHHTWASIAAMNGIDMVTIAKLHLADDHLVEAAEKVGRVIAEAMKQDNDSRSPSTETVVSRCAVRIERSSSRRNSSGTEPVPRR